MFIFGLVVFTFLRVLQKRIMLFETNFVRLQMEKSHLTPDFSILQNLTTFLHHRTGLPDFS
jgi:hypothetical protein